MKMQLFDIAFRATIIGLLVGDKINRRIRDARII